MYKNLLVPTDGSPLSTRTANDAIKLARKWGQVHRDGAYKIISFHAKRARGLMARHAILHRAKTLKALLSFDAEGYAHDAEASAPDRLVFRRRLAA